MRRQGLVPCSRCGDQIEFLLTERGKWMPVDPIPVHGGNIVLDDERVVHVLANGETPDAGAETYLSHFATCDG